MPEDKDQFKVYESAGEYYKIDPVDVDAFKADIPDAKELTGFTVGKDTFQIGAIVKQGKVADFIADFPDAKPLYVSAKPAGPARPPRAAEMPKIGMKSEAARIGTELAEKKKEQEKTTRAFNATVVGSYDALQKDAKDATEKYDDILKSNAGNPVPGASKVPSNKMFQDLPAAGGLDLAAMTKRANENAMSVKAEVAEKRSRATSARRNLDELFDPIIDKAIKENVEAFYKEDPLQEGAKLSDINKINEFLNKAVEDSGALPGDYSMSYLRAKMSAKVDAENDIRETAKIADKAFEGKYGFKPSEAYKIAEQANLELERAADGLMNAINGEREIAISQATAPLNELAKSISDNQKLVNERYTTSFQALESAVRANQMTADQANAMLQELNAEKEANDKAYQASMDQYVRDFELTQKTINSKFASRYGRQLEELELAAKAKIEKLYKEGEGLNPSIIADYEAMWKDASKKRGKIKDIEAANMLPPALIEPATLGMTFINGLGNSLKTYSEALGWEQGVLLGENISRAFVTVSPDIESAWDYLKPGKFMSSAGFMVGNMGPQLLAQGALAYATGGMSLYGQLALQGTVGLGMETVQIAQAAKSEEFARSGDIVKADKAAEIVISDNLKNFYWYGAEGIPFIRNLKFGIKGNGIMPTLGRAGVKVGAEFLTETGQESIQTGSEERARLIVLSDDERDVKLSNFTDIIANKPFKDASGNNYTPRERLYNVALNVLPSTVMLGGFGEVATYTKDKAVYAAGSISAMKNKFGEVSENFHSQYMYDMFLRKGENFTAGYATSLNRQGLLSDQQFEKIVATFPKLSEVRDIATRTKMPLGMSKVLFALQSDVDSKKEILDNAQTEVEREMADMKYKAAKANLSGFVSNKKSDYVVMQLSNGEQYVSTYDEFETLVNDPSFVNEAKNNIRIAVVGSGVTAGGVKIADQLQKKLGITTPTPEEMEARQAEGTPLQEILANTEQPYVNTMIENLETRMTEAQEIPTSDINAAIEGLYKQLELIYNNHFDEPGGKAAAQMITDKIDQLQNYEFRTDKETQIVAETAAVQTARKAVDAELGIIQVAGASPRTGKPRRSATVTFEDGRTGQYTISVRDGQVTLEPSSGAPIRLGDTRSVNESAGFVEMTMGKNGMPSSVTFTFQGIGAERGRKTVTLNTAQGYSQEELLDILIDLRAKEVGTVDPTAFDTAFNEIATSEQEVTVYPNIQRQDAVQEQAAGRVPVQPETRAGEEVAQGEPQAEPQAPTETRQVQGQGQVEVPTATVESVQSAISGLGVDVLVIDTQEEYDQIATRLGADTESDAMFVGRDGKIYLNAQKISDPVEGRTIIFHEGAHPIMNLIRNTNPKLYNAVVQQVRALSGDPQMANVIMFAEAYSQDGDWRVNDELVVETIARIADGRINTAIFSPSLIDSILELVNKIASVLGLPQIKNVGSAEARRTMNKIVTSLRTGADITKEFGTGSILAPGDVQRRVVAAQDVLSIDTAPSKKVTDVASDMDRAVEVVLSPSSPSTDRIKRFLENAYKDLRYFFAEYKGDTGLDWYTNKVKEFNTKLIEASDIAIANGEMSEQNSLRDKDNLGLFNVVLALSSIGINPRENVKAAFSIWKTFNKETGQFSKYQPGQVSFRTSIPDGKGGYLAPSGIIVKETKTSYDIKSSQGKIIRVKKSDLTPLIEVSYNTKETDKSGNIISKTKELRLVKKNPTSYVFKSGKQIVKIPASDILSIEEIDNGIVGKGWTTKGNIVAVNLERVESLISDTGSIKSAIEWMNKKHPISELRKYNETLPDVNGGKGKINPAGERIGSYIIGEKLGAFHQNVAGTPTELTMDLWWSRTWNRYMGTLLSADEKGNPIIQETPRTDTERNIMREAASIAAEDLGLEVHELQAALWYLEQQMYKRMGAAVESYSFVDGVNQLLLRYGKTKEELQPERYGIDISEVDKRRSDAASRAANILFGEGVKTRKEKPSEVKKVVQKSIRGARTAPVNIPGSPAGTYINVGLLEGQTENIIPIQDVLDKLPEGVDVISAQQVQGTEPTVSININRKLTDTEMDQLLLDTKQMAIPQLSDGEGVIHGTEDWGPFSPQYFVLPSGQSLAQYTGDVQESRRGALSTVEATAEALSNFDLNEIENIATIRGVENGIDYDGRVVTSFNGEMLPFGSGFSFGDVYKLSFRNTGFRNILKRFIDNYGVVYVLTGASPDVISSAKRIIGNEYSVREFNINGNRYVAIINDGVKRSQSQNISMAYHKAKADGTNQELVNTVEKLLQPGAVQESRGRANKIEGTYYEPNLTTDKDGNFVFFHVSNAPEKSVLRGIDSRKFTSLRTSREEKGLQYGVASFYTKPTDGERMVGGDKYYVTVPADKVYPMDADPNGYREAAAKKIKPGTPFREEKIRKAVAEAAAKDGFQMAVGEWGYDPTGRSAREIPAMRGDALTVLKPKPYTGKEGFQTGEDRGVTTPHPMKAYYEAKTDLNDIADSIANELAKRNNYNDAYDIAKAISNFGGIIENYGEPNERVRDITTQEFDVMYEAAGKANKAKLDGIRNAITAPVVQKSVRARRMATMERLDAILPGVNLESLRDAIKKSPTSFYTPQVYKDIKDRLATMSEAELLAEVDFSNSGALLKIFTQTDGPVSGLAFLEYITRMTNASEQALANGDQQLAATYQDNIKAAYETMEVFSTKVAQILRQLGEVKSVLNPEKTAQAYADMIESMIASKGGIISDEQRDDLVGHIQKVLDTKADYKSMYESLLNNPNATQDDIDLLNIAQANMIQAELALGLYTGYLVPRTVWEMISGWIKGNLVSLRTVFLGLFSNSISFGLIRAQNVLSGIANDVIYVMNKMGVNTYGLEKYGLFATSKPMKAAGYAAFPVTMLFDAIKGLTRASIAIGKVITGRQTFSEYMARSPFATQSLNVLKYGASAMENSSIIEYDSASHPYWNMQRALGKGGPRMEITAGNDKIMVQRAFKIADFNKWLSANLPTGVEYSSLDGPEKKRLRDQFMSDQSAMMPRVSDRFLNGAEAFFSWNAEMNFRLIAMSDVLPKEYARRIEFDRLSGNMGLSDVQRQLFIKDPLTFISSVKTNMTPEMIDWWMDNISEMTATKDTGIGKMSMAMVQSIKTLPKNIANKLSSGKAQDIPMVKTAINAWATGVDTIIPFVRIPMNFTSFALDFVMPYKSLAKAAYLSALAFKNRGTAMSESYVMSSAKYVSRAVIGYALQNLAIQMLSIPGMVSAGSPKEDDDEEKKFATKIPRNSINADALNRYVSGDDPTWKDGDTYMSLNGFGVLGLMLYSYAAQQDSQRKREAKMLSDVPKNVKPEKVSGISDILDATRTNMEKGMEMAFESLPYFVDQSWFVGVSSLAQAITDPKRGGDKFLSTWTGSVLAAWWGFSSHAQQLSDMYRETTGKPVSDIRLTGQLKNVKRDGYPAIYNDFMNTRFWNQVWGKNELIHKYMVDSQMDVEYISYGVYGEEKTPVLGKQVPGFDIVKAVVLPTRAVVTAATPELRFYMAVYKNQKYLDQARGYSMSLAEPGLEKTATITIPNQDKDVLGKAQDIPIIIPPRDYNTLTPMAGKITEKLHAKLLEPYMNMTVAGKKITPEMIMDPKFDNVKEVAEIKKGMAVAISEANRIVDSFLKPWSMLQKDEVINLLDMDTVSMIAKVVEDVKSKVNVYKVYDTEAGRIDNFYVGMLIDEEMSKELSDMASASIDMYVREAKKAIDLEGQWGKYNELEPMTPEQEAQMKKGYRR